MINEAAAKRLLGAKFRPDKLLEILRQIHVAHPEVCDARMTFDYQELTDVQVPGEVIPYITFGFRDSITNQETN